MVKNIVFDIGNVLADFKIKEFLAQKGFDALTIVYRLLDEPGGDFCKTANATFPVDNRKK